MILRDWPLGQEAVCEVVRVRIVRSRKDDVKQYRELRVRSEVAKAMANISMERHVQDLGKRPPVLQLVQTSVAPSPDARVCAKELLRAHIEERINAEYPASEFGGRRSSADRTCGHQVFTPVVTTSRAALGRSRGERTRREEDRRRRKSVVVGRCCLVGSAVYVDAAVGGTVVCERCVARVVGVG